MKNIILNYREFKSNGDDYRNFNFKCSICGNVGNAYIMINHEAIICKSCLYDGIDGINELSQKMFRGEVKNGRSYPL